MIYGLLILNLIVLAALLALIYRLLMHQRHVDLPSKIDASLKEQFLNFQTDLTNQLNGTRQEVGRSKDLIAEHALKTIETIKNMGSTIHKIVQQQEDAHKLGQSLKDLLQAPKLRGNYGEAILEEMLERVLPQGIWERQYMIDNREQVDVVVRFKDIVVPIDAKFPRDDYQRYYSAANDQEKSKCWKEYETAVKRQIKSISEKYVKPEKGTSDFALMFIPSEAIYYETIAEKNHLGDQSKLYEYAQQNRVIPVSPNTFYAFLQVIIIGIRNIDIIKNAKKLQEGLVSMQKSFDFFHKKYTEIGKCINNANEAFRKGDDHVNRYKERLDAVIEMRTTLSDNEPPAKEIEE